MKKLYILLAVLSFALLGCSQEPTTEIELELNKNQSNEIEEVVNNHNDIKNLEGLDRFVKNVENQNEAKINYIQYGIEGQKGVRTLKFDGEEINVSHSVNGDFIEEYNCQKIKIETEKDIKKYILSECTGNYNGDFELLSIQNK
ncbi:DUF4362 domain-containing protein [Fictibacillus nanhaiensis]|uniref:DUF4362 domain-containing protein n=1 Tax=Fictibacillus nanhaiensis TaxID=742169 RepID=UPI001C960226|nr:DUF4362 domain-containing protein [Fictibacillus nanhaiensis]MBY6037137.1 DUF4362 domain-containing protein [Fictibacillus nanhaiensis]